MDLCGNCKNTNIGDLLREPFVMNSQSKPDIFAFNVLVDDSDKKQIIIVSIRDWLVIGESSINEIENFKSGIELRKPFNLFVNPIYDNNILQTVSINFVLPREFGGYPILGNQKYSGFVYVTEMKEDGSIDVINENSELVSSGNTNYVVNKVFSIADVTNPIIKFCNIDKIFYPSLSIKSIYKSLASKYFTILNDVRGVDTQRFSESDNKEIINIPKPNPTIDDVDINKVN